MALSVTAVRTSVHLCELIDEIAANDAGPDVITCTCKSYMYSRDFLPAHIRYEIDKFRTGTVGT